MKLIEIVKSEYATFPAGQFITQNGNGHVYAWRNEPFYSDDNQEWSFSNDGELVGHFPVAEDYHYTILTPADFATKVEPAGDRLYEIKAEVKRLEGEITERIEQIRVLKDELAQHGFSMPFRRGKRRTRR